jgi:hypothetical protein
MILSDAQFGALTTVRDHGPINAQEVLQPPKMDGSRRVKLECHVLTSPTLEKLETAKLVAVSRGEIYQKEDATGRKGNKRRNVCISITADGLAALG